MSVHPLFISMSGPPSALSLLNRAPSSSLPAFPNIGGAPPRGENGGLPSGTVSSASVNTHAVSLMANATANYAFFLPPMRNGNDVKPNDILLIFTGKNTFTGGQRSEVFGRTLRNLTQTRMTNETPASDPGFYDGSRNNDRTFADRATAAEWCKKWRLAGVVAAVSAGSSTDRMLATTSIRGRVGVPRVFCNARPLQEFFIVFRFDSGSISVFTESKYPGESFTDQRDVIHSIKVGKYIRPIGNTSCSSTSVMNYIAGRGTVSDQQAVFEVAMRL